MSGSRRTQWAFEAYQGIDLLLESFAIVRRRYNNAHLILVGGRPEQVDKYRAQAAGLGLRDATTFTGTIHPRDVQAYLRATDVIISPRSRGTNTPLKIYGYLRTGKPLVATDRLTHTQTLTSEISELVPATADGLANGVGRLFDDPDEGQRIAKAALAWADSNFSDDGYIEKVNELYADVMSRAERKLA